MRLARLDLLRYGKFTGHTLDFGPAPVGGPDLHLVYGANEAGKSTAFSAWLDLLYGIGGQSPYAFLHPYAAMRIGARLELAGGAREVLRIKRQSATLLDPDERALDEGLVAAELGGIGREAYRAMFSLDDDSLEQGGRDILASRGDLGQLLFSGSAGAAGLGEALERVRLEAEGLHRPNSGKTALGELRRRLDALKAERTAVDTQASAYRQQVEAQARAEAAYAAALAARSAAGIRRQEIERLVAARPRLDDLRAARAGLAAFAGLPQPPPGSAEALRRIQRREIEIEADRAAAEREVATLAAEIEAEAVDAATLAAGIAHDGLAELRARAVTAAKDLPDRRLRLAGSEAAVAAALARLGPAATGEVAALAIDAHAAGTLRGLVADRSGVAERLRRARVEASAADRDLADARAAVAAAGVLPEERGAASRLAAIVDRQAGTEAVARLRAAERAVPPRAEAARLAMAALRPWTGTADELEGLVLPEAGTVEDWAARLRERTSAAEQAAEDRGRHSAERERLVAEVDALGRLAGVVTAAEAIAVRTERDRAWAVHRARLDVESADAFADALARDDLVTGARHGQAAETARLRELSLKLASLEVTLHQATARSDAADARLATLCETVAAALARITPPLRPETEAAGLLAWMGRRTAALAALGEHAAAEREVAEACADVAAERARLADALAEAGVAHDAAAPLERLLALARDALERDRAAAVSRERLAERERGARSRTRALADAEAETAAWEARWQAACAATWLGTGGTVPAPAAVVEVLDVLNGLAPELRSRAELAHRIAAMEVDADSFAARLAPLAGALGVAPNLPPLELDRTLAARIRTARETEAARRDREGRLADARERRARIVDELAANRAEGEAMRRLFGVDTLAEVGEKLEACAERDRRAKEAEQAARDIRLALRTDDLAEAEARLAGLVPEALESEGVDLAARYEAADAELRDHHARRLDAEARLAAIGGDEAAARIEGERRTTLLELEEAALRYLRLSAGVAAAEIALKTYRDRHRSAMLAKASEAFRLVSRGAYRGLATQPGDKGADVLLAVAADGKSKAAAELSKGTRFQLYLALRAAGYHAFAKTRGPVPFVADDIMETFDDVRAEEAFRLFAGMAQVGQVIYLTHHRHLVEIARSACPAVRVQELDGG